MIRLLFKRLQVGNDQMMRRHRYPGLPHRTKWRCSEANPLGVIAEAPLDTVRFVIRRIDRFARLINLQDRSICKIVRRTRTRKLIQSNSGCDAAAFKKDPSREIARPWRTT